MKIHLLHTACVGPCFLFASLVEAFVRDCLRENSQIAVIVCVCEIVTRIDAIWTKEELKGYDSVLCTGGWPEITLLVSSVLRGAVASSVL